VLYAVAPPPFLYFKRNTMLSLKCKDINILNYMIRGLADKAIDKKYNRCEYYTNPI